MKRFGELNIKQPEDNKVFACEQVRISDIQNIEIEIHDFLPNVKTKHGEGRYLVYFKRADNGTDGKFFTNSSAIKSSLDQVDKDNDLPFLTVVKAVQCGKGTIYVFT